VVAVVLTPLSDESEMPALPAGAVVVDCANAALLTNNKATTDKHEAGRLRICLIPSSHGLAERAVRSK
jgi:hypothetical protein